MIEKRLFKGEIYLRLLDNRIEIGIDGQCPVILEKALYVAVFEAVNKYLTENLPKLN